MAEPEDEQPDVGLRGARAQLGKIALAASRGQITYLTSNGYRVAAVVPVSDAEDVERLRRGRKAP